MERKPALPPFPFPSDTAGYREAIEARIQSGDIDPDVARAVLEELDKRTPPKSPLERRIEELELILASPVLGEHAGSAAAVLEGYKSGTLEYLDGKYYIFKEGKRVAGPRPCSEFDPKEVLFGEFPNPRGIWAESCQGVNIQCQGPLYMMPAFRQTLYPNGIQHPS